ncbi:MAG: hypothetical protein L6R40_001025 [Gallowayella cf. fulva]|nr:MAG: hypothetical protein L6R40_001025 [Xanthomendoza cf. fulva]
MSTLLPPFPRLVFTILEPLACIAGYIAPVLDTAAFAAAQVPSITPTPLTSTSQVLALQLGNCYGLIALIAIGVLYSTNEPKVVRNYLVACAIADVGHLWVTYVVLGYANFVNVKGWNSLAWGNIGFTFFLFVTRIGYLAGVFGNDRVVASVKKRA